MLILNILVGMPGFTKEQLNSVYDPAKFSDDDNIYTIFDDLSDQQLKSIDIQVGFDKKITNQLIDDPDSNLKWIQAMGAGVDYLPLDKLKQRHILVSNVSGIHAEPIAESTIGMILAQYRDIDKAASEHKWYQPDYFLPILRNKKVYVFGTGSIGNRIGKLAKDFNADTVGINHNGHPASGFNQTKSTEAVQNADNIDADIIVNALPLTDKTKNFYNQTFFDKLTNQPLFVTIGRGPSTNTDDLIDALNDKKLGAASLDVTDPEPLPEDNPLWKMENVLIMPHTSGSHKGYIDETLNIFLKNLKQFEQDGSLSMDQVNLNSGY